MYDGFGVAPICAPLEFCTQVMLTSGPALATGFPNTTTCCGALVAEHPAGVVTVTLVVCELETVIQLVVAKLPLHE